MYFLTPIIYPITSFPERYGVYLLLNPFYPPLRFSRTNLLRADTDGHRVGQRDFPCADRARLVGLGTLLALDEDMVFRM